MICRRGGLIGRSRVPGFFGGTFCGVAMNILNALDIGKHLRMVEEGLLANDATSLTEPEQELLAFIQGNARSGVRTTVKSLIERFERKNYGWYYAAILCNLALLCARGKVEVRQDSNSLEQDALERGLLKTQTHPSLVLEPQIETVEDREKYNRGIYGIEKKPLPYLLAITNMLLHDIDNPQVFHGNSLERNVREYKKSDKFDIVLMNPPYGGTENESVKINFPADLRSSETADLFMSVIMYRLNEHGRAGVIIPDGFLFGTDNAKVAIKKKLLEECNLHTVVRMPSSVFAPYTSITTNILFFDKTKQTDAVWFYRMDMPEGYKHFSKTKPMKVEHFDDCVAWWTERKPLKDTDTDTFKAKDYTVQELAERGYDLDLCGYPTVEDEVLSPEETIQIFHEKRDSLNARIDKRLAEIEALLGVKR